MILLFSLFLGLYQLVLDSKDAIMVFFNFLNFFAIFLEFSIPGRVGIDRNDTKTPPNLHNVEKKNPETSYLTKISRKRIK